MTRIFACIGTREPSQQQTAAMRQLGAYIVSRGGEVSSGLADGSDNAFGQGANSVDPTKLRLALPWRTYNQSYIVAGNKVVSVEDLSEQARSLYVELARRNHPAWDRLKQGAQKLHTRNGMILFPPGLSTPVDAVIALPSNKLGGGGTGQGMRMAQSMGIPLFDLSRLDPSTDEWSRLLALIG